MVSKEPHHLLTGHNNTKSTLADKLPGTMTVRSVLLNRDSPDIESRLRRRRNRTHQVRFKDLEDGSSSSGNSGTGETNSHQRAATDSAGPHSSRKPSNIKATKPWVDKDSLRTENLLGKTSVVGAVRGDMAGTLEVMAAFLARAPTHPLTPGPTRRSWVPPQTNFLTLPMTRKPSTSTSTAIQTSPCLKKPQTFSSANACSHGLGDSVGADGDDEHDSQDEYVTHNHVPGPKDVKDCLVPSERSGAERRAKSCRAEHKSAVTVVKSSRNSNSPTVSHINDSCCPSSSCRDGSKRQGSSTPSLVRRRKRLSRTTSDPGKEVSYCTTPTQTESSCPSPATPDNQLHTTHVQTEIHSPHSLKYSTTQCQTESPGQSPHLDVKPHANQVQPTQIQNDNPTSLPPHSPSTPSPAPTNDNSLIPSPPALHPSTTKPEEPSVTSQPETAPPESALEKSESHCASLTPSQERCIAQITIVPYCTTPPPTTTPTRTPERCSSPAQSDCISPSPLKTGPTSTAAVARPRTPDSTVVSPPSTLTPAVETSSPSTNALSHPMQVCSTPLTDTALCAIPTSTILPPTLIPSVTPSEPSRCSTPAPNKTKSSPDAVSDAIPSTNQPSCTYVTQTAISCTSISYYTTTHSCPHSNSTVPSYATVIQTVSHCNIPMQNASSAIRHMAPYSSPVPTLKSCSSPSPVPHLNSYASVLTNAQLCATPTKVAPLYSSTFRAAPPYTPPSQAPHNTQDKRGIRLPPPPPPPPPYTPRKEGTITPGLANRIPMLRADRKSTEKDKEREGKDEKKVTESPKLSERTNSLKHRASTPSAAVTKGENQSSSSSSSPSKTCFKPNCLSSAQAHLGVLHKMLCSGSSNRPSTPSGQTPIPTSQQVCSAALGCSAPKDGPAVGALSVNHADTLRQVQEIIGGLMSGARCKLDPAKVTERLLSPNGPLHDIRSLQNQLQSLEGVLETSQNTIKVLLDVIQDLEKKEAERDGRNSYRTGQDIENCGTCRDCACIIYSVEHDFRLQEGQVVRTWKVGDPPEGQPECSTPEPSTPHHHGSPQASVASAASVKKNRKKCFWFL